jgi:hypothetical protein
MNIRKITESDIINSSNLELSDLNKWGLFIENTLVFFSPNKDSVTDMKDSIRRSFPEKG